MPRSAGSAGRGQVRHFVRRRGLGFLLAETVAVAEGHHFVGVHGFDDVVVQLLQLRFLFQIVAAREQPFERLIEFLTRFIEVTGTVILLAGFKRGIHRAGHKLVSIRRALGERGGRAPGIKRQWVEAWRGSNRDGRRTDCHGVARRVRAARGPKTTHQSQG